MENNHLPIILFHRQTLSRQGLLIYLPDAMLKSAENLLLIYFGCGKMGYVTGPDN